MGCGGVRVEEGGPRGVLDQTGSSDAPLGGVNQQLKLKVSSQRNLNGQNQRLGPEGTNAGLVQM